jgi:4-aminobutyrate aminotransferase / (S)-3-amino-2-methylpropionate transaminase / 5-aminovalerate transaminase
MGVIRLTTEIPGPRSRALIERRQRAVPRGVPLAAPVAIASGENAVVTDADGNRFIDFAGGIGTLNTGHRHPAVVAAAKAQLDRLIHTSFQVAAYEPYLDAAERLNAMTPGDFPKKTMFVNSGAEAVENAIKIARIHTGRPAVLCFEHAFHGRTLLTMTLTAKVMPYKKGFGPFAPEVYRVPYPYCYRCDEPRGGGGGGTCCRASRDRFEALVAGIVDADALAAVIIELQLGEGGFVPAPPEFVSMLAQFCRDHGIVLIDDEIQTGFGRTGRMFAAEHYDLTPDLLVSAKSLAGGLPLGAITGRAEIMDTAHVGGLGGTFAGNPVALAAAVAVLDVLKQDDVAGKATRLGDRLRKRLAAWSARCPAIGDVRGLGSMVAMELVTDRVTKQPAKELAGKLQALALTRGLLLLTAGTYGNVIRFLVPLTVEDAVVDEGLDVLERALIELTA